MRSYNKRLEYTLPVVSLFCFFFISWLVSLNTVYTFSSLVRPPLSFRHFPHPSRFSRLSCPRGILKLSSARSLSSFVYFSFPSDDYTSIFLPFFNRHPVQSNFPARRSCKSSYNAGQLEYAAQRTRVMIVRSGRRGDIKVENGMRRYHEM